jgi:hypothetical protein
MFAIFHNRLIWHLPNSVIASHFERIASGVRGLLTGKPCPPERCQRVCAAQPPDTSKRDPVVSSLAENNAGM